MTIASRSALILVDSLAVVVTWWQTRAAAQLRAGTMKQPSLERVMWENGELCAMIRATPGCILIYNCLSVTQELSISGSLLLVDSGSRPVSSILMNLHAAR